jgi:hypothetical protein
VAIGARADLTVVRVQNAVTRIGITSFYGGSGLDYVSLSRTSTARLKALL